MNTIETRFAEARRRHASGDLQGALSLYQQVLQEAPRHVGALHGAGVALLASGRSEAAAAHLEHARTDAPADAVLLNDLAVAYRLLGRLDAARDGFAAAGRARADYGEAWHNLGLVELARGDAVAARAALEKAIAIEPGVATTHLALGVACGRLSDHRAARDALRAATRLAPNEPRGWINLALAEIELGAPQDAIRAAERGQALAPQDPDASLALGIAASAVGDHKRARAVLPAALAQRATRHEGWLALSIAAREDGDASAAVAAGMRALELAPQSPDVVAHVARAHLAARDGAAALALVDRLDAARQRAPEIAFARADALMLVGRQDEALDWYRTTVELAPCWPLAVSALLFRSLSDEAADPARLADVARHWATRCLPTRRIAAPAPRASNGRLRIGYVSPDFARHSVAFYLRALLPAHDPSAVEVTLYATSTRRDDFTDWFRSRPGIGWRDLSRSTADDAAAIIEADGIDVLVDLAGHTRGGRLDIFALAPAPTQVAWLGWAGTTGVPAIGWRLGDAIADPAGCESAYSETLVRMADGFHVWRAPDETPALAAARDAARPPTFGSFNHAGKISDATIRCWSACLAAVPGARLLIKCESLADAAAQRQLRARFARHAIAEDRIEIIGGRPPLDAHLALYERIDVALDTFPYNGTTTTLEALWMGVPVVVRSDGDRHAARVGASLLVHAGMPELVAADEVGFVALASTTIGAELARREARRDRRAKLAASPLCDATRFARKLETTLADIHARR